MLVRFWRWLFSDDIIYSKSESILQNWNEELREQLSSERLRSEAILRELKLAKARYRKLKARLPAAIHQSSNLSKPVQLNQRPSWEKRKAELEAKSLERAKAKIPQDVAEKAGYWRNEAKNNLIAETDKVLEELASLESNTEVSDERKAN